MNVNRKLAVIVCCSETWIQIPVGTFGISSYLEKNNIEHRILHSHLQSADETKRILAGLLDENYTFALVLHWKENIPTFLYISKYLKSIINDPFRLVCAGMTASFFYNDILNDPTLPDIVFCGDSEQSILDFCKQKSIDEIKNIAYKINDKIFLQPQESLDAQTFFSSLAFTYFDRLINSDQYIHFINKTYFHINLSRGCLSDCRYCGGSHSAYMKYWNRKKMIYRSSDSVINDIMNLYEKTVGIEDFLNIHIDDFFAAYIPIVTELSEKEISRKIKLTICERGFLNIEKLTPYIDAFKKFKAVAFEISPETDDDRQRKEIMSGNEKHKYNETEIKKTAHFFTAHKIYVKIFYTVYNFLDTKETVFNRLLFIRRMKSACADTYVSFFCSTLALDCGSSDYDSLPHPPGIYAYNDAVCFNKLFGNLTYTRNPRDLDYIISARFYTWLIENESLSQDILSRPYVTLENIYFIVKKYELSTMPQEDFFSSGKFISFIIEKLKLDFSHDAPAVPTAKKTEIK